LSFLGDKFIQCGTDQSVLCNGWCYVSGRDGGQAGSVCVRSVPARRWCQLDSVLASSFVQSGTCSRVSAHTTLWRLRVTHEEEHSAVPYWQGLVSHCV